MDDDGPDEKNDAQYKTLRGLTRGLELLRVLNTNKQGRATIAELSSGTGLHRATVRRLLETFIADGYIRRSESDGSYQLSLKVRELSEGFTDVEWISKIATPVMGELMQKVVWPSDLSTPSGDAMMIRETTHRFSPLSFHRSMVGRRLPILLTAAGRAYFAFCSDDERERIIRMLRLQDDEQGRLAADGRFTANLVKRVRADGFASNEGDWATEKKVGAIALPVINQGRIVACLNIVYLSRALNTKEAHRKYGDALQEAVTKISTMMDATHRD